MTIPAASRALVAPRTRMLTSSSTTGSPLLRREGQSALTLPVPDGGQLVRVPAIEAPEAGTVVVVGFHLDGTACQALRIDFDGLQRLVEQLARAVGAALLQGFFRERAERPARHVHAVQVR